jgi:hypothetical protein
MQEQDAESSKEKFFSFLLGGHAKRRFYATDWVLNEEYKHGVGRKVRNEIMNGNSNISQSLWICGAAAECGW